MKMNGVIVELMGVLKDRRNRGNNAGFFSALEVIVGDASDVMANPHSPPVVGTRHGQICHTASLLHCICTITSVWQPTSTATIEQARAQHGNALPLSGREMPAIS